MKREADRGYALLLAIAILAALFAIAAPFLLSARGSARSSGVRAGEARARIEAEAGFSTLVRKLEETDPEVDVTPGFDGEDEARPEIAPPQALYPTRDPGDAIVSGHAVDEQSRVDLGSASPYALGALMGAGFLTAQIAEGVDTLPVDATDGFPADGYLWVRGELIRYSAKTPTSFTGCERGVLGTDRGPYEEARAHPKGTPVLDARAHHAAKRRIRARENELAKYPTVASLVLAAAEPASAPTFTAADLDKLEPWLTIWADRNGHDDWSAAVRVIEPIVPDGKARTIAVEDGRWFGPGSTVRLQTNDGVELQLVVSTDGNRVTFEEPLRHGAGELEATAAVLVPNPIDVNSAPPELLERLLTGLDSEWAGAPDPLSRSSARELAKRIHEKPVTGFQDLVERILLPAADEGLLSGRQLHAVFANAENSNNRTLKHSTVPFTFGAGSVFRATVAASVNAPSGVERGRVEIEKVVEVRRQSHGSEAAGIRMVSRQSEWDERLRLSRRARGWMSYPYATTQFDGSDPPSRRYAWLHPTPAAIDAANANAGGPATMVQLTASQALGPIPPSNDPALSWAQLAPARSAYPDDRSEHFDLSATPEGQDLSKIAYSLDVADAKAGLGLAETGYFYAGSISGWFRTTSWGGTLFDTGAASLEHDRVTLSFEPGLTEGTDLVLRVRDGAGDDPDPAYLIPNEIRYPASQLTPDVWHHFSLNVHGSGPGDMALFVDGLPRGERKAFTRLTADLATWQPGDTVTPISVESTSGFPPFGVLRIGNELIDYSSATGKVFDPSWKTTGAGAYTGRRLARAAPEELLKPKSHTAGETVELYGYTARLSSWSYPGNGTLTSRLEKFSAARLDPNMSGLKEVAVGPSQLAQAGASFGNGILGGTSLPELQLDTLDPASEPYYLDAFPSTGGYVVVFQFIDVGTGWGKTTDQTQSSVFGCELMRYGSRQGKKLLNVQRGVVAAPHFPDGSQDGTGSKHAFVLKWGGFFTALAKDYRAWVYVVPCSIPMTGAPAENYLRPGANDYGVIQLLDGNGDAKANPAKTEWVQYDTITSDGQFARLAKARWDAARLAVSMTSPPGLPTGGGTMGPKGGKSPPPAFSLSAVDYWIGEPDEPKKEASLVNAIRLALSFRGTNGTWSQRHELPTQIIPAFLTFLRDPFAGRPGRLDRICFMSPKQGGPTLWRTVNWSDFKWWDANKHAGEGWVATLEIPPSLPIPPGQDGEDPTNPPPPSIDSRDYGRILKAPSHELPRNIGNLRAGATFDGSGQPFGGTVDEIEFTSDPQRALAQRYVLASPVGATDKTLPFEATFLAFPHGLLSPEKPALAPLPADAGFLLLGNEVVAYDGFDAGAGTVTVANNGRGALGTEATPHGTYETAVFLDNLVATKLSGGVSQAASRIAVDDAKDFPPQGTVLIGNELLHYTHKADTELRMPEREKDSIDRDPRAVLNATREGTGVFRGRYGTPSETHASGDIVLRFPYRYWDRWAVGTDVPELSYFQVDERSAEALFRRVAWTQEIPNPNVSLECVARVDARVPWASEPAREGEVDPAKLLLFTRPGLDTTPNYVMRMGERIEVRFGVRYGAGAFDPIAPTTNETKRSDAWKITPRLRSAAIEAIAATRVVRREERR